MSDTERTFVVGVDYSDHSIVAVDEALRLAAAVRGTRLVPVLVLPGGPVTEPADGAEMTNEVVSRSIENLVQLVAARAKAVGVPLPSVQPRVRFGAAAERLIAEANELEAQLIAVGTHGRQGLSHLLLGSVAEEVMRQAPCSVLVARLPEASSPSKRAAAQAERERQRAENAASRASLEAAGLPLHTADGPDAETTVVNEPHIDAGRVVLHVLDAPSGQVFLCAFEHDASVVVEPLEGNWVPAPSSDARARVARIALSTAARESALFGELFQEIARRSAHSRTQ